MNYRKTFSTRIYLFTPCNELKMKKIIILLVFITQTSFVQAIETPAAQAILYDYETKSVIFEKKMLTNLCHLVQ